MVPVVVPQLGNEISEAEVTEWLKATGETVAEGESIVTITTTKMAMDIEAPAAGVLKQMVEEGEIVEVGAPLAEIE